MLPVSPAASRVSTLVAADATPPTGTDFLARFRAQAPSLPVDFFTESEIEIIQRIFQSYQLSPHLCLVDLLGFDFFVHLEGFCADIQLMSPKNTALPQANEKLLHDFGACFLGLYIKLFRNLSKILQSSQEDIERYSLPEKSYIISLESFCRAVSDTIKTTFEHEKRTAQGFRKDNVVNHYRSGLAHIQRLMEVKDLFAKILLSPFADVLLLRYDVSFFPGSNLLLGKEQPISRSCKKIPAFKDICKYLQFITTCMTGGFRSKISFLTCEYFEEFEQLVLQSKTVSPDLIASWGEKFHKAVEGLLKLREMTLLELHGSIMGVFTHELWLEKYRATCARPKEQDEFKEFLFSNFQLILTLESWLYDIDTLVGLRLFQPSFPQTYILRDSYLVNSVHEMDDIRSLTASPAQRLEEKSSFNVFRQWMRDEVDYLYHPFVVFFHSPEFSEEIEYLKSFGKFYYSLFLPIQKMLTEKSSLLETFLNDLTALQETVIARFQQFLETVPLETLQKEKAIWLQQLKNDLDSYAYCYLFYTLITDAKMVRETKNFMWDDHSIPLPLRSLFSLHKRFQKAIQKAEQIPKPEEPEKKSIPEVRKEDPLTDQLKSATKRREFENLLRKSGFKFVRHGKGSHTIWGNDKGTMIVLPHHSSLKPGTRDAIVKDILKTPE